ncbi:hypothetical protein ACS0TY_020876 [Phlomoides rotata]
MKVSNEIQLQLYGLYEITTEGVLDFLLIFFSELGDKTFFIVAKEEAEAALAEELHREENFGRKLQDEQENERQLAAKEASLHQEPTAGNENVVTLLVRMPDGSRRGRRFLKTDNLQVMRMLLLSLCECLMEVGEEDVFFRTST